MGSRQTQLPDDGFINIEQNAALHETIVEPIRQTYSRSPELTRSCAGFRSGRRIAGPSTTSDGDAGNRSAGRQHVGNLADSKVLSMTSATSSTIQNQQHRCRPRPHSESRRPRAPANHYRVRRAFAAQGRRRSADRAIVEDGNESVVFVQPDAKQPVFTLRPRGSYESIRPHRLCPCRTLE